MGTEGSRLDLVFFLLPPPPPQILINSRGARDAALKETRRREFPLFYAKGKKLFNVVVHISDAPGSMGKVLDALGARVNLIGTSSYSLGDGSAMFAAFAEALDRRETPATLKGAIDRLEVTIEAEVSEGKDGLLVDTFHTGIQVGGDGYMLMSREGLSEVLQAVASKYCLYM
jgi:hypothetical protein